MLPLAGLCQQHRITPFIKSPVALLRRYPQDKSQQPTTDTEVRCLLYKVRAWLCRQRRNSDWRLFRYACECPRLFDQVRQEIADVEEVGWLCHIGASARLQRGLLFCRQSGRRIHHYWLSRKRLSKMPTQREPQTIWRDPT